MNPLAHVTVGCGVVWLGSRIAERALYEPARPEIEDGQAEPYPPPAGAEAVATPTLSDRIDYRLVAVGALLPDLVDKPIGKILFRGPLEDNGHVFGHTLLFTLAILLPGIYLLARAGDPRLLAVAVGSLSHIAIDPVNHAPRTLFWPLLGLGFPHVSFLDVRATIITEAGAGLMLLVAAVALQRRGRLGRLVREGRL